MSPRDPIDRRRALALLAGALGLLAVPLVPTRAWADDDDEDHSGSGGGGDDHDDDDDDDHSGPGGGGDDDRDEDHSGSGRGGDDDGDDRSGPGDGRDDGRDDFGGGSSDDGHRPRDIAVYYPDGWIERIVAGRYELIDHQRRLVVARTATSEDFARMIALR